MRRLLPALVVCMFASIFGCGIPNETEANRKDLEFEGFPSYTVDRPIVEPIQIVVPMGNGAMVETVEVETVKDGNKKEISSVKTTTNWDIDFKQEQITTTLHTLTELSTPDVQNLSYEFDEELISDAEGKKISYQADFKGFDSEIPSEMVKEFNELQPKWITAKYHLDKVGMLIKSGDQLQPSAIRRYLLRDTIGDEIHSKIEIPEIIEGYGTYKDKKVIVTSYSINNTFNDEGATVQIKGRGFNLYDAESHVEVRGEFLMRMNVSDSDGDIFNMETRINQRCDDYTVNGLIRAE